MGTGFAPHLLYNPMPTSRSSQIVGSGCAELKRLLQVDLRFTAEGEPIGMEGARPISTLIGMGTEVITLCLEQVGG